MVFRILNSEEGCIGALGRKEGRKEGTVRPGLTRFIFSGLKTCTESAPSAAIKPTNIQRPL
jgi:hypothetical protein